MVTFVTQLRQLNKYCDFGNNLEGMLRDYLVCRIMVGRTQCLTIAEPKAQLIFTKALYILKVMEVANQDSRELQTQLTESALVNAVT